ncbi:N-6 DNA methylase [bacterium]|nr:N-6 DNA methylase [bacterium]
MIENYIQSISSKFSHEETSEMGYRTDFENLIQSIFEAINVRRIDHDARAREGNKPDFIVLKFDVPILYIETKNIGISLDKVEKSEQMARYYGYANLVLTDYVEFRFYRNGKRYEDPIKIAHYNIKKRTITPIPENYEHVVQTLIDFTKSHREPIRSGEHLSKIMGGKAQRIRDNIKQFLSNESEKNAEIMRVYDTIKKLLVHDLTKDAFADMYAQTLVYGLFVARYHDKTPETFSRQEARDLIPKSNPLLQHFFDHIVGPDFDKRLEYIANELCEVFSHANVHELMRQYYQKDLWGGMKESPDPVIHFYEDFLKEYDPVLRKKLGAFYTPLPVVRFIVRSVDYLLQKEFGLPSGLADTSKLANGHHRVQILDPAVGTGTFISAVIRIIYERLLKNNQKGRWPSYVHHDLLPRLHGFELMMAPYTIAHLKLSMAFKETGFWNFHRRLGIYLTNSLEESSMQNDLFTGFGFAESISNEAREASVIKNETPIMVVIGNPPYSVSSSNKGKWIQNLVKDYKTGLKERNIQPLSDDYIKFIRYAEHFIEKNGSGIVAMITNNSFLDGIIHRQMRKHLIETFDDIYILNLHGNSKKKETAPDGGKDENVFDIQQGVSISIFLHKIKEKKGLGTVNYSNIYGKRIDKFHALNKSNINTINWKKLSYSKPYYFLVPKDFALRDEYTNFCKVTDIFKEWTSGVKTHRDHFIVGFTKEEVEQRIRTFIDDLSDNIVAKSLKLKDTRDWKLKAARTSLKKIEWREKIIHYSYRPFDDRYICYLPELIDRGCDRYELMKNFFKKNIGLTTTRRMSEIFSTSAFSCNYVGDIHLIGDQNYFFPLYLYTEDGSKIPNLKKEIFDKIEKVVDKTKPEDIFYYIYAVLHSPKYRERYKEFLKIDFPRVPYPKNVKQFKVLVKLGAELGSIHLLESPKVNQFITTFPVTGSDVVEKVTYENGNVFINKDQYFGKVPETAWNFYIGGYQPAQKWLKDRKGRKLTNKDIEHYQKIIVALVETDRIMKEIDKVK